MTILFCFIKFKINLLINNLKLKQLTNDETCQILLRPNAQKRGRKKEQKTHVQAKIQELSTMWASKRSEGKFKYLDPTYHQKQVKKAEGIFTNH
jgi:hypothetical protein